MSRQSDLNQSFADTLINYDTISKQIDATIKGMEDDTALEELSKWTKAQSDIAYSLSAIHRCLERERMDAAREEAIYGDGI